MTASHNDVLEAGRIYKSTGAIPSRMLRSKIYRAWERSHLQGANPYALQAEKLSRSDTEHLITKNSDLMQLAKPYIRMLSQAAGTERHAVMLSDNQALLLDVVGDQQTVHGTEAFPEPGSWLSESVAGANGIGTPLAEADYVEIISAEHFIEGFHPFTCQGIPLRNDKQEIIGVLSISMRCADAGQRLKEILLCASHGVEADLLSANLEKDVRRVLKSNPDEYQPLEDLRQDIIQAHHAARLKLEVVSRMVAVNRLDYAMQLVRQAEDSIELFRRRAEIWRNLASFEMGRVQPVSLTDQISNLIDLLSTEVAIRQVEIVTQWDEPIIVMGDPRSLLRYLLRYFLQAFEQAGKGGKVELVVNKTSDLELVKVSFMAISALQLAASAPQLQFFYLPINRT
ncbi:MULTISPECIES: sigma-54-dependent Fis family transcriptional regulator [Planktothrix]|uniref:Sigma-54-dependent Fis family transcriptional regulator n=1 Tax=Planktothrix mougeotii LEGE 06226 TaxID=1828728 RepID=A0ABR9UAP9_9CYAN|nr:MULTISPECIES: sigma-54-dependent Fis family transcriptional regulator [Planktothrix]MBD2483184.1 sigma-54-dependent Fis family transcriptional regulator [Planktothrix sp. FACHB-1365]MBE9143522.1 sigma-54-dependent Fis family transcriptional regulator [Planktothrix mougeotii LEGE 06226]